MWFIGSWILVVSKIIPSDNNLLDSCFIYKPYYLPCDLNIVRVPSITHWVYNNFIPDLVYLQVESNIQIEGMDGVVLFQLWGTRMYRDRMFQVQDKMKHVVKFLITRVFKNLCQVTICHIPHSLWRKYLNYKVLV
jgi:hypothetical protein